MDARGSEGGETPLVLHVDDEPGILDLAETFLEREGLAVETATGAEAGLALLEERPIDCVVSDYDMPGLDGLDFLEAVREDHPDLPFILFTGKGNEEIASEAISRGVTDYLQKETGTDQYAVLANRIEESVRRFRAESELAEARRRYETLLANLPGMAYRATTEPGWPMSVVSEGCRALTGHDPEAVCSGAVDWERDVIVEADREPVRRAVETALDRGEPFEVTYEIERADGERRIVWEQGRAVAEDGDETVLEGFVTDVTARERNERRLRVISATQRAVLQRTTDGVLVVDPQERTVVEANPAAAALTGIDQEELGAADPSTLFAPAEIDLEAITERTAFERELRLPGPDGPRSRLVHGCSLSFEDERRLVLVVHPTAAETDRVRSVVGDDGDRLPDADGVDRSDEQRPGSGDRARRGDGTTD